jgi:hypothetical protein
MKKVNKMQVIFCEPQLTNNKTENTNLFFAECRKILDYYLCEKIYIGNTMLLNRVLEKEADKDDILIFFNSEDGNYDVKFQRLIRKYYMAQSRIWPIALEKESRMPPEPVLEKQSFDIPSQIENRTILQNSIKEVAHIFSRKIIAQTLSPLYHDEVLYFISHRRKDGENITAKLADELRKLTRERNVYRDVVNVKVGENAQEDIEKHLAISDVLIFIQTEDVAASEYVMKELCFAIVNNIPVLWIQIDDASYEKLRIRPGEKPDLRYRSEEFKIDSRLEEIANEVEDKCFEWIMASSNQVSTYIEYLDNLRDENKIKMKNDMTAVLAYEIEYEEKTRDQYDDGIRKNYIQCFGRNPQKEDVTRFLNKVQNTEIYNRNQKIFLLSNNGKMQGVLENNKIYKENYDDYIMNLENVLEVHNTKKNERIILSGSFPDGDEVYKVSLMEAVMSYAREIIKNGYTLVFGAHPTFQRPIFDIGKLYSQDMKYSIEMHMSKEWIGEYDLKQLQQHCTLILSENLEQMRNRMICEKKAEILICLGGKVKKNRAEQGVDTEIQLAKQSEIPVALIGSTGGRTGEYALNRMKEQNWRDLNTWDTNINEELFYNVNHKLMAKKLLQMLKNH